MEHNIISIAPDGDMMQMTLFQRDNNLDRKDNLDQLPAEPAVFAVCGRVNGQPANPRFVGDCDNLRTTIRQYFSESATEADDCVKEFMLSIKTKELLYVLLPGSPPEERSRIREDWKKRLDPHCTKELNEIH